MDVYTLLATVCSSEQFIRPSLIFSKLLYEGTGNGKLTDARRLGRYKLARHHLELSM